MMLTMCVPMVVGKDLWHTVGQYANERERRVIGIKVWST